MTDSWQTLVVPGYDGSGPEHWQSRWEAAEPDWRRVEQRDWLAPERADWVAALDAAVAGAELPVVLVAHSLGCATVAHWAAAQPERAGRVRAALLVAPADVERIEDLPLSPFAPVPTTRLPFPTLVVGSDDDPYCAPERAAGFARAWGAEYVELAAAGHINSASGLGEWPAGRALLEQLVATAG
ncbi:alpha/beta fold hydrolase [Kitasatospora sp. NBC_01250]|uniref:RBBP9/YdeN family alpha/beta hydrolase n=1 Tax=Kitasatospora sp. NBC_01250 TaxID=2903571 RepID=UPI002E307EDD|nr:alpha/beta fold hydrolase [Kitasatospora sp. NBC_01250]